MTKAALIAENEALKRKNEQLEFELSALLRLVQGFKSEKFKSAEDPVNQLSIFDTGETTEAVAESGETTQQTITYSRKKNAGHPGRNPIPDHLPVEEIIIEPLEDTTGMIRIGEERVETLEYIPPTLKRILRIRPKYALPDKSGIVIAPMPERPIPRCIAEASLLAQIIIDKLVDHLPFYRQAQRFKRTFAWHVNESTLNDWFVAVCTLLKPLYRRHKQMILEGEYLQADESTIKVQDTEKVGATHLGYMWVYHSVLHKLVLFDYQKGRGVTGPERILRDYTGMLQTDGYEVYNKVAQSSAILHVGCLAHARRKFFEALDTDKARSEYALSRIQQIYKLDKEIREAHSNPEAIKNARREQIGPVYHELAKWCDTQSLKLEPKSMMGRAVTYMQRQWPKLHNVLEDGRLLLDNNLIENAIRPLALGRKNYLFAGSHEGAKRLAMMYSFLVSCKIQGLDPAKWLKTTIDHIQDWPINRLEELLPNPNHIAFHQEPLQQ
jgi:transposase